MPCAFSVESGTEPNKTVPDPVRGSSLDQATTKQRGQGGRPTATHHHSYRQRTPQAAHGHCRARNYMAATQRRHVIVDNDTRGDSPSSYRARALLGLVLRRCPEIIPSEHMQGGSRCPGPAVESERARWHDPVLGRWLGLTPEQPALCL